MRTKSIFDNRIQDARQCLTAAESELQMIIQQNSILNLRYDLNKNHAERHTCLRDQGHKSLFEFDNALTQELTLNCDIQGVIRAEIAQKNLIAQLQTELGALPDEHENQV